MIVPYENLKVNGESLHTILSFSGSICPLPFSKVFHGLPEGTNPRAFSPTTSIIDLEVLDSPSPRGGAFLLSPYRPATRRTLSCARTRCASRFIPGSYPVRYKTLVTMSQNGNDAHPAREPSYRDRTGVFGDQRRKTYWRGWAPAPQNAHPWRPGRPASAGLPVSLAQLSMYDGHCG